MNLSSIVHLYNNLPDHQARDHILENKHHQDIIREENSLQTDAHTINMAATATTETDTPLTDTHLMKETDIHQTTETDTSKTEITPEHQTEINTEDHKHHPTIKEITTETTDHIHQDTKTDPTTIKDHIHQHLIQGRNHQGHPIDHNHPDQSTDHNHQDKATAKTGTTEIGHQHNTEKADMIKNDILNSTEITDSNLQAGTEAQKQFSEE